MSRRHLATPLHPPPSTHSASKSWTVLGLLARMGIHNLEPGQSRMIVIVPRRCRTAADHRPARIHPSRLPRLGDPSRRRAKVYPSSHVSSIRQRGSRRTSLTLRTRHRLKSVIAHSSQVKPAPMPAHHFSPRFHPTIACRRTSKFALSTSVKRNSISCSSLRRCDTQIHPSQPRATRTLTKAALPAVRPWPLLLLMDHSRATPIQKSRSCASAQLRLDKRIA